MRLRAQAAPAHPGAVVAEWHPGAEAVASLEEDVAAVADDVSPIR